MKDVPGGLLEKAAELARSRLSKKRYTHVLGVADTAERLARIHGLPPEKARLAALLHDVARESGPEELLESATSYGIEVDSFTKERPMLLHGPVAAEEARREIGVEDQEVLEAVRVHTTGGREISPTALAVYVADKIEPGRDYPSVGRLRELAERDLYETAASILRATEAHNANRGKPTHLGSRRMLEWLESRA
jgi:predicted HD superfamily hydrolase involved in NAD metabolism